MTNEQKHKILEKLAYYYAELCEHQGIHNSQCYNYIRAEEIFMAELEINGEDWLLSLLEGNKDENNTKI